MRYSFYEQKDKFHADPRGHRLPEDINAPVLEFLAGIGCEIGQDILRDMQACFGHGEIVLRMKTAPDKKITIEVAYGMADGYRLWKDSVKGEWEAQVYKNVKNKNLDKSKAKSQPRETK